MLAAVLKDFRHLVLEEIPEPDPGAGEVVVRIVSCGFCQTDYKAIQGMRRNVRFPLIAGHEPAGIVAKVGAGVKGLAEGDEVILQPSGYCGRCVYCREGNSHYCTEAFTTGGDGPEDVWPGSFAEFTKTTALCCFRKPAEISFDAACLTEPLSGAWKGVVQYSQIEVGEDVVVIGVGGIGLLCLMVAKAAGAGRLIAVDTSEYALANARRLGATHTLRVGQEDTLAALRAILPQGPDLVVEAAGAIQAVELARDMLRRGTRWNIFGITTHEKFEMDGGLAHFLEARMDASFGTTPLAMQKAIRLMECGLVNPEEIISHRFALSDIHQALEVMAQPDRNKVIINP